jgi:hypothetical protein
MIAVILVWFVCGVYGWGTTMAYFDAEFPSDSSRDNSGVAAFTAVLGPPGAIIICLYSNFNQHGWHLWKSGGGA